MPLRRIFLLGAATIASVAALVAIVAVVNGDFGETEGKIFATLAATFVAGSTVVAAVAFLARGASRPIGVAGIGLAVLGYLLWVEQIWAQHDSEDYWKFLVIVLAWTLAALIVVTNRLLTGAPRLLRTLYPATGAAAAGAAALGTLMILREQGDGWQILAVLVILALLGEVLAPILDRYAAADESLSERVLGVVGGAEVLAVRGRDSRSVLVGATRARLAAGEELVVRERH